MPGSALSGRATFHRAPTPSLTASFLPFGFLVSESVTLICAVFEAENTLSKLFFYLFVFSLIPAWEAISNLSYDSQGVGNDPGLTPIIKN